MKAMSGASLTIGCPTWSVNVPWGENNQYQSPRIGLMMVDNKEVDVNRIIILALFMIFQNLAIASVKPSMPMIGIAYSDANGLYIYTTKSSLNNKNILICFDMLSATEKCTLLPGESFDTATTSENVMDISSDNEIYTFKYRKALKQDRGLIYGIAVISPPDERSDYAFTSTIYSKKFSVILVRTKESYDFCTSTEGIHIYSPTNKQEMHLYIGLGYEISETCPRELFQ